MQLPITKLVYIIYLHLLIKRISDKLSSIKLLPIQVNGIYAVIVVGRVIIDALRRIAA